MVRRYHVLHLTDILNIAGTDLPFRKVNGYDLLSLDKYDHSIYNSVIYLLTLRAAEKLAAVKNEDKLGNLIKETFTKASKRIDVELWDKEKGFYHAWWDMEYGSPSWIMSDSLYGQMWAYTLGVGEGLCFLMITIGTSRFMRMFLALLDNLLYNNTARRPVIAGVRIEVLPK